jgi:S-adenosylmethionine decarboxylase
MGHCADGPGVGRELDLDVPAPDSPTPRQPPEDHFIERDGVEYAGTHLILDLWEATRLDDPRHVESALREAARTAGATVLHVHLHRFTPNGGISGVAVLAESHISIHTWPERDYAALDVFMCGSASPERTVPVFRRAFRPGRIEVGEHLRGRVGDE